MVSIAIMFSTEQESAKTGRKEAYAIDIPGKFG
jgi:hypothetical protein